MRSPWLLLSLLVVLGSTASCDSKAIGSDCRAAGGTCTAFSHSPCTQEAPSSAQDCNPERTAAGSFCCLDSDAGDAN